ncbi:hypothetical protein F53441_10411 [Fusarium austroafricanum]|uniref:Uncharacterized protein n=1 Tax=Fusarium austroafricanum TaxID=2364996 RepID=A0A8H4K717_9HYPO|nr:hypothetical protein F53441_10411 [Fusarium austroafricanum]
MEPTDNDAEAFDKALMAQMGFSSFGAASPPSKRRRYNPNADASLPPKPAGTGANSTALGTGSNRDEISLDDDDEEGHVNSEQQLPAQARPASLPQRPATAQVPRQGQHSESHGARGAKFTGYYDRMSNENPWAKIEKARGLTTRGTWISRDAANAGNSTITADAPVLAPPKTVPATPQTRRVTQWSDINFAASPDWGKRLKYTALRIRYCSPSFRPLVPVLPGFSLNTHPPGQMPRAERLAALGCSRVTHTQRGFQARLSCSDRFRHIMSCCQLADAIPWHPTEPWEEVYF